MSISANAMLARPASRLASIAAIALAWSVAPALAQNAGDAVADTAAAEDDEIVVTAQRREQRLLDTPVSIGVLSGATLERAGSRSVADALSQVGGVSLIERAPGNVQVTIRGVVADPAAGTSTTGYYLDEVPFSFITLSQLPDTSAYDLARVEVLRGPQGTLYGANALSGVVRVLGNDPDPDGFETKGRLRLSTTRDGSENYQGDLMLNVPLADGKVAIRGVVSYADLSGYIDSNLSGVRDINATKARNYRLKLLFRPVDALTIRLGYTRSDVANRAPAYSFADRTTNFSANQPDKRVYDTYNLIAEYQFSGISLLSSTSYLDYRAANRPEILLGGAFRLNYFAQLDLTSFAQEVRLASNGAGPWQWTAGAIYKRTSERQLQNAEPVLPFDYIVTDKSRSYALFGELTRTFADGRLELTGGLRYFHDHLDSTQQSDFFGGTTGVLGPRQADFERVTGRGVVTFKPSADNIYYASVATGFRSGLNQAPAVTDLSFPALDPDTLISYEVGTKGQIGRGLLTYDLAVHYTRWNSVQQSLLVPLGFVARVNAGKGSGLGVDGSITLRPVTGLSLNASVGWSDLAFDDTVSAGGIILFAKGDRVNFSPEWTLSLGADYRAAGLLAGGDLVLSANYSYRSGVALRYLNGTALGISEAGGLNNLNASLGVEAGHWTLGLFADNLLDSANSVTPPELTFDNQSIRQRPRTFGIQASFRY